MLGFRQPAVLLDEVCCCARWACRMLIQVLLAAVGNTPTRQCKLGLSHVQVPSLRSALPRPPQTPPTMAPMGADEASADEGGGVGGCAAPASIKAE